MNVVARGGIASALSAMILERLTSLPPNRLYGHTDFLAGSFVVCGSGGEDFVSLTDRAGLLDMKSYIITLLSFSPRRTVCCR
ncbi:MAG: hypothetical protein ACLT3F_07830 [Gemmiger formicilis]|uniref:hypothetical protein n=1 Tax=Gemmiger formicilis TaxID=745368 RepID=UPI0039929EAC